MLRRSPGLLVLRLPAVTFAAAVKKARRAMVRASGARQALADRDVHVALAFAARPPGATWPTVVAEINAGLPEGAQVSVRTARLAWERNRPAKTGEGS